MVTLSDTAARGTGVTLAAQALRAGLQFASVVVLARLLTPEDFGLVAMVAAVIGIADLVRDFGLSSAAIQAKTLSDAERTNLFWVNLAMGTGCAALVLAARPWIVDLYGEQRLSAIVVVLSSVFVLSGATTQFRADLTRRLRFSALAMTDVLAQASGIAAAVSLAVAGQGLWALVYQQVVTAAVLCASSVYFSRWLPGLPDRNTSLRRFFRFGGGLLGTQAIHYLTKNVDNVALGAVWGAVPLGLYSRAYQLLMMPLSMINAPMTRVALPVLSRVQQDDATFARYLQKAQLVACYLTATLFTVGAGLAAPVVLVLLGEGWAPVAPIFAVLAIGGVFRSVSQISYWIYLARARTGAQLRMYLSIGPVMVLLILAGVPWGPIGVAVGHSVAHLVQWVVALVHAGRAADVDVRPLFRTATRSVLLVSAPCGLVAHTAVYLPVPALVQLLAGVLMAGAYVLLAAWLLPWVRADVASMADFGRRVLRRS